MTGATPPGRKQGIGLPRVHGQRGSERAGEVELSDGRRFFVTVHCVDRFWQRAAAGCVRFADALERPQLLVREIGREVPQPDWVGRDDNAVWIALGPDVVLVVERTTAVTCLTRGSLGDERRQRRNATRPRRYRDGRAGRQPRPPVDDVPVDD